LIPGKSKSTALFGPNVTTGGVHPLVKKAMMPVLKRAKAESLESRSKAMAVPPKRRK